MHALDYLVAGAVMIILIMFSYSILTPTVYIPITHIKEQQLDVLAERLIDKILLTPGIPYDWGEGRLEDSSIVMPTVFGFGLALNDSEGNAQSYVLDVYKLLRLKEGSLTQQEVARLLGLTSDEGHLEYGFNLTICPVMNITVVDEHGKVLEDFNSEILENITVKVVNHEGIPLPDAKVYIIGMVCYVIQGNNGEDDNSVGCFTFNANATTNVVGEATIAFNTTDIETSMPSNAKAVRSLYVIYVDFYGLKSYKVYYMGETQQPLFVVGIEGNDLMIGFNSSVPPGQGQGRGQGRGINRTQGARHLLGIYGIAFTLGVPKVTTIGTPERSARVLNYGSKNASCFLLENVEQQLNAIGVFFFYAPIEPKYHLYVYSLQQVIGSSFSYGSEIEGGKKTVVVAKRLVKVEGMDYVVIFKLWRMAED